MIADVLSLVAGLIIGLIQFAGYAGVFALMALESANIPIPSEIIMPFSGFIASRGNLSLVAVIIVGASGNLFGSLVSYWFAEYIVKNRHKIGFLRVIISDSFLNRADNFFSRYGSVSVFFSRMLPVVRTFISLPAGLGKMNLAKFSVFTFLGSLFWSWALAYLGWVLGNNWRSIESYFRKFDYLIVAVIFAVGVYWFIRHFNGRIKKNRI